MTHKIITVLDAMNEKSACVCIHLLFMKVDDGCLDWCN